MNQLIGLERQKKGEEREKKKTKKQKLAAHVCTSSSSSFWQTPSVYSSIKPLQPE
jgi:hypothetical protein